MSRREDDEFSALMERVLAGSEDAARELVEDYGAYILFVVRRRLHNQLRAKFDSRDFEQDVWASFFADLPQRQPFQTPEELIAFLTTLARNKVVEAVRQRLVGRQYSIHRETPLDEAVASNEGTLAARQATPSEVAMGREEWERLLEGQPVAYRRILMLLQQGKSLVETARQLDLSERTVRRVVEKVAPWLIA